MPFLNGGQPQNTGGLGRESGLGHSLAQPVGPKWGHLAISGDILGCHNWGRGVCYWHPVGKGRGFCATPPSAQDSSRQKRMTQQLKCQSCRGAGCVLQASLPATFCSTPNAPFRGLRWPHRPLLRQFPKASLPKSHPTSQFGGIGERRRQRPFWRPGTKMFSPPISYSRKGGIPDVGNLWSNKKT